MLEGKHLDENQVEKSENPIQADINGEEDKLLADKTPTDSLICTICKSTLFLISLILSTGLLSLLARCFLLCCLIQLQGVRYA